MNTHTRNLPPSARLSRDVPVLDLYYQGPVERWVPLSRRYEWFRGYSEDLGASTASPACSWNTKAECRSIARQRGMRAVFHEERR